MYTKDDLTWGFELELSNVPKDFIIPDSLGKWEYCEVDIINTKGEFANVCADPLGINPPFGGEINTKPTNTKEEQVDRIIELIDIFRNEGYYPDCGITSHSHVHVHVKGLEQDFDSLMDLFLWLYDNQECLLDKVYRFDKNIIPNENRFSKIRSYLMYDGARLIPDWLVLNELLHANDFNSFLYVYRCGKSMNPVHRHLRHFINMYSLKFVSTIEFRCFRGTVIREQLSDIFEMCELIILNALNNGLDFNNIWSIKNWNLPETKFDIDQAIGWYNTKHDVELISKKNRKFWEVV